MANAYLEDALELLQEVEVELGGIVFSARGSCFIREGFYKVFPYFKPKLVPIPKVKAGANLDVLDVGLGKGETKPPKRLTEPDLLKEMIKNGIGTDATRAMFPELILRRKYAFRRGRAFAPTSLGSKLVEALEKVDEKLVTTETRSYVEELMNYIGEGKLSMNEALNKSIETYKNLYLKCERMREKISNSFREAFKIR